MNVSDRMTVAYRFLVIIVHHQELVCMCECYLLGLSGGGELVEG